MLGRFVLVVSAALLLLPAASPAAAQQPAPSAADVTKISSDVKATIDKYYRLFSEQNMKALPEEVYLTPWILLGGNGPEADLTKEQALARFEASLKQLLQNGWGKSVFTTENVCVLNPSAALASGFNTRYKKDGSVMSVGGVTYLLGKTKEGWRIVSYTGHPKDKVVRCN
jgi:hypothetical protein